MRRPARRPPIICHRGHWKEAPENSLPAVRAALELPVEGVEIDVHCTADGVPVVMHDRMLDRTTDGHGLIAALTLAQVRALRLRNHDGSGLSTETVPTLQEVLSATAGKRLLAIEVKPPGIERAVLDVVRACHAQEWVWVWSFINSVVQVFHELAPAIPGGYLSNGFAQWPSDLFLADAVAIGSRGVSLAWEDITPEVVVTCHDIGLGVYTFARDEPAAWDHALASDIDALITEDALGVLEWWRE
jgi:glycerophosphoryl diester phosphodiesterase